MHITLGLVEDQAVLADDLVEKLSLHNELRVVLTARNGVDLLDKLQQTQPQVLLMDIEMDQMDGIEATRHVKALYPPIKIIMLTVFDDDQKLFDAIRAGASGYLLKDTPAQKLGNAIQEVLDGGAPMSPSIASKALNLLRTTPDKPVQQRNIAEEANLTQREQEVLELLAQGLSVKQISEKLFVVEKTIRKHLEHIYEKLQVDGSRGAIIKYRNG
jgi:DNA-binding NarL/FixJ family response regulator